MKKIAIIGAAVVALILVISLVSCHDDTPSQTAVIQAQEQALTQQRQIINQLQQGAAPASSPSVVAPAPVIVQQPAVVNNGDNGLVTGMVLGHLLSGGAGYSGSHTTVVNHYSTTHTAVNATRPVSRSSFFSSRSSRSYSSPVSRSSSYARSSYSSGARSSFSSSRSFGRR